MLRRLRLNLNKLVWPDNWKPRKPIVNIIAFILMPNHFHLLVKEIEEGGVAKFMQRVGTGMTMYYNAKYQESGTLFQGSYKARCVDSDLYLKYLSVYIQVKNTLELYPGGLKKAIKEISKTTLDKVNKKEEVTIVELFKTTGFKTFMTRSQAKRILYGLDKFKKIILDFKDIDAIGQGFADEIFRVWQKNHQDIDIEPINVNEDIELMIKRSKEHEQ